MTSTRPSATVPASAPGPVAGGGPADAGGRPGADGLRQNPVPAVNADLGAAQKVVGASTERHQWLAEMLVPGGMSPGMSSRAHARAFRFAASLERAGYIVAEGPYGPRGGRRFIITGYGGPRLGALRAAQEARDCALKHEGERCACFDDLSTADLRLALRLTRRLNKGYGRLLSSNDLAAALREYGPARVNEAADLYLAAKTAGPFEAGYGQLADGRRGLRLMLDLVTEYGRATVADAIGLTVPLLVGRGVNHCGHDELRNMAAALAAATG